MVGIEIEHFIVHRETMEAVSYYGTNGVKVILEKLMNFYPGSKPILDEDIVGFYAENFNITLEPAAQFEISINPYEDIEVIEKIYKTFLNNISYILNDFGYKIITLSCHPKSKIKNIKMIPKKRYEFMDRYFKRIGTNGIEMMKGTCSVQASIDYFSEEDFRKKMQVAYFLTPLLKLISNNSNSFQGNSFNSFLKRTEIYNNTDPARCGILPHVFSRDYKFKDYAEYLCNIPLIFYKKGNEFYETDQPASKIFDGQKLTEDEILHVISLVFPDVRLKKYLEIRAADLMPIDYILGYCVLIKGIFYSNNILDCLYNLIKEFKFDNKKFNDTQDDIIKLGWSAKICGVSPSKFANKILELVKKETNKNELKYLDYISLIIKNKRIPNIKS